MNQLKGRVNKIQTHEGITLVELITLDGMTFTSVVIEADETLNYIQLNKEVKILFKETEVIIAKGDSFSISVRNKIPCEITTINFGKILCQLHLLSNKTEIKSIITKNACTALNLQKGDKVFALIKANEISLASYD